MIKHNLKTKKDFFKNLACEGCRNITKVCFIYLLLNSKVCPCINCLVKSMCQVDCENFHDQFDSPQEAINLKNNS